MAPARWWRVGADERAQLLAALLGAVAVIGPLRTGHELSRATYGGFTIVTSLHLADIPVALLLVVALPGAIAARRRGQAALALAALVAWLFVALAVHFTSAGMLNVLRLAGALAIAVAIAEIAGSRHATAVVRCLLLSTAFQGLTALAQVLNDGPLGLSALGEKQELTYFGSQAAGQGTFNHPYILVGWTVVTMAAVVSLRTRPTNAPLDHIGAVLVGGAVGATFSRAAAIGLACAAPALVLAVRRRPAARRALLLVAAGAVATGLVFHDGWISRARQTAVAAADGSLESASNDRSVLVGDALEIIGDNPLAGVGPTRYLAGLDDIRSTADDDFKPVHDVPLLVAAESGVPGAVLVVVLILVVARMAFRGRPLGVAVAALYAPFVLLDHFPYYSVQGIIATGTWVGVLDALAHAQRPRSRSRAAPGP